ncbi:hypothetical protein LPJ59_003047 [Coemansia sp. RSA 2399]|nr:hypothetical protein LPJ59_003047 [Coemansia sp. RSA 2399]
MKNALVKTVLVCTVALAGFRGSFGQEAGTSNTQFDKPFPTNTWFSFDFSSDDGLNEISPGLAVKETSEEPSSSSESELGDLPSDSEAVPSQVDVQPVATTSIDMETVVITITMTSYSGIPTVTVTDVVTDTWSSGNADQTISIPAQLLTPDLVTVTQTYTSVISNTASLPTSVQVVSVTTVVTETASQAAVSPVTSTVTESETTTETVTETTTLEASTDIITVMSTFTDVVIESSYVVSTSYDIETRTFTLPNGFLSYMTGFSEQLWAPTYTQETTVATTVYTTEVVTV